MERKNARAIIEGTEAMEEFRKEIGDEHAENLLKIAENFPNARVCHPKIIIAMIIQRVAIEASEKKWGGKTLLAVHRWTDWVMPRLKEIRELMIKEGILVPERKK